MTRYLALTVFLVSSVPCYAKGGSTQVNITKNLDFSEMCKQKSILKQFPQATKEEGRKLKEKKEKEMFTPRHPDFKDTPEELDKALVAHFDSQFQSDMKTQLYLGCSHYGCDLLTAMATIFTTGCNQVAGGFAMAKGAGTMKEAVETGIREGQKIVYRTSDVRYPYLVEYVKKRRFLSKGVRKSIETQFSTSFQCEESNLTPMLENISKILNIPLKSIQPRVDFSKKIKELAKGYILEDDQPEGKLEETESPSFEKKLRDICITHLTNYSAEAGPNEKSRQMVCLKGPSGLGKSYILEALGKSLGVPVIRLILQDPKSFIGDSTNPGALLLALCSGDIPRNAILLIDEVDQVLGEGMGTKTSEKGIKVKSSPTSATASWLDFFDPDKKQLFFPFLNTWIDISHLLVLMTCNGEITQPAIKDRIPTVTISDIIHERKMEIITKSTLPKLLKSKNPHMDISMEEFEQSGINIEKMIAPKKSLRAIERELLSAINDIRSKHLGNLESEENLLIDVEDNNSSKLNTGHKKKD